MGLTVDINKDFGDFTLTAQLDTSGLVTGLLGASGSGKSITMMCVAGIVKPDSGRIILNDRVLFDSRQRINIPPQERRVGYLFQNCALFPTMTVRQNILCALRTQKNKAKKEDALQNIIEKTELTGLEKRFPHQLSGGQRQRVALARILIGNPELLILDEPFSASDSHLREQLQTETRRYLKRFGIETILVTHSRDEIYYMCGNIALIDSGAIICQKETKQLFSDPGSIRAAELTGCKNIAAAEKTGANTVYITDWGVEFTTLNRVRDGLRAVGIRAHYFDTEETRNSYPVRLTEETEKPFEYIVQFRYDNQREGTKDICRLLSKERKTAEKPERIGVSPENIMLLYE